jgi:hypothetical protein
MQKNNEEKYLLSYYEEEGIENVINAYSSLLDTDFNTFESDAHDEL